MEKKENKKKRRKKKVHIQGVHIQGHRYIEQNISINVSISDCR